MKRLIKGLTPPLVWESIRKLSTAIEERKYREWEYVPEGWEAEKTNDKIKGWNVESVLEGYKADWDNFFDRLDRSLSFDIFPNPDGSNGIDYNFHNMITTYAYSLLTATKHKSSISMLDWGGAIGHYYLVSKKIAPDLAIDYHCKEVPVLAEYGQSLFPETHFYDDDTCLEKKYDFVLVCGAFHYMKDWTVYLEKFARATEENGYLLVTRLPVVHEVPSFVIVQRAYRYGYDTEYLSWCFNRGDFLKLAEANGLKLVKEFLTEKINPVGNAPEQPEAFRGFLFFKET
ncbi:MAG: methyltransferase domain-containing protein [Xenococcaceae cyanobacterium]